MCLNTHTHAHRNTHFVFYPCGCLHRLPFIFHCSVQPNPNFNQKRNSIVTVTVTLASLQLTLCLDTKIFSLKFNSKVARKTTKCPECPLFVGKVLQSLDCHIYQHTHTHTHLSFSVIVRTLHRIPFLFYMGTSQIVFSQSVC